MCIHSQAIATVEQVTLLLGVSGVLYKSSIAALKDKLGVTGPQINNLLTQLHHSMAERERDYATLNSSWCVIGCLRLSRCYPLEIVDLESYPKFGLSQARQCSAR